MGGIFISYRRGDSKKDTDRISDWLIRQFGRRAIFQDVDSIPAGVDFRTHVRAVIGRADIQIVVIGSHWLTMTDETGARRLDAPNDPVRIEIETAFAAGIPIIPVLVSSASMPSEAQLPESIANLASVNAIVVRENPDFSADIKRVIQAIRQQRFTPTRRVRAASKRLAAKHRRRLLIATSAIALLAVTITALATAQAAGIHLTLFASPPPRATATTRPTSTTPLSTRIPAPNHEFEILINIANPTGFFDGDASARAQVKSAIESALSKSYDHSSAGDVPVTYWQADEVILFGGAPSIVDSSQAVWDDTVMASFMVSDIPFFDTAKFEKLSDWNKSFAFMRIIFFVK